MPPILMRATEADQVRSRYAGQRDWRRRGDLTTTAAAVLAAAELVLAQATLGLTACLVLVAIGTRWRPVWLAVVAASGVVWMLAVGLGPAAGGYLAVAGEIGRFLAGPGLAGSRVTALSSFISGRWMALLVAQLPAAVPLAAVQAFAVTAVRRARRGGSDGQPGSRPRYRPGLVAGVSRLYLTAVLRRGEVATSDGACLGVRSGCGRRLSVSWRDAAGGILCTGADALGAHATALAFALAAIQHRKAVVIVDLTTSVSPAAIERACRQAGAPVRLISSARRSSWPAGVGMRAVVADRSVALFSPGGGSHVQSRGEAGPAVIASLTAELPDLASGGVAVDCLVWISGCEAVSAGQLSALLQTARAAGLTSVLSTVEAATAATIAADVALVAIRGPAQVPVLEAVLAGGDMLARDGIVPGHDRLPRRPASAGQAARTGGPRALTLAWRGPAGRVVTGLAVR
jgi:hypothetical protein